ncbi:AAEL017477-PA [Aedes aegypti]|uniref:AAEL017477-PA n=1 Tax=Aedes aegypti TaxID=7159 RepID=J9HGW1_AEDAE|nr:AAEL017477-PA [Aedes aegypti]
MQKPDCVLVNRFRGDPVLVREGEFSAVSNTVLFLSELK